MREIRQRKFLESQTESCKGHAQAQISEIYRPKCQQSLNLISIPDVQVTDAELEPTPLTVFCKEMLDASRPCGIHAYIQSFQLNSLLVVHAKPTSVCIFY